jgi:HSP20 family protein
MRGFQLKINRNFREHAVLRKTKGQNHQQKRMKGIGRLIGRSNQCGWRNGMNRESTFGRGLANDAKDNKERKGVSPVRVSNRGVSPVWWNPFEPFPGVSQMFKEMETLRNTLFRDVLPRDSDSSADRWWQPSADIHEEPNAFVITVEMPGVSKENITVDRDGDSLLITGEKKEEISEESKEKNFYRKERRYGSFERRFQLPENANSTEIKATFDNGVLKIQVPKKEPTEKVKINVE